MSDLLLFAPTRLSKLFRVTPLGVDINDIMAFIFDKFIGTSAGEFVWVATDGCLLRWREEGSYAAIYGLAQPPDGNVWLGSSDGGVSIFDGQNWIHLQR